MNDTLTPALAPHRAARPEALVGSAEASRRHCSLVNPRSLIAIWSERMRVRWELAQMSKENPHLIDDIGLTRRQVEAEIAKPFWQR